MIDTRFNGKVALVTGGAHRVGKAIAHELGARGATLALHYNSSKDELDRTVAEFQAENIKTASFHGDLTQILTPDRIVHEVMAEFGRIDILVNSAAVMMRTPIGEVTVEEWDTMFAINTRAPFFLIQSCRDALKASNGCVVNIADIAAFESWPAYVPHSMTKAAVVQMTRSLAKALAPEIRVNAVAPGAVMMPESWDDGSRQRIVDSTPLKRIGDASDVAEAVVYLAAAQYVTGEVLVVDGGRSVRK